MSEFVKTGTVGLNFKCCLHNHTLGVWALNTKTPATKEARAILCNGGSVVYWSKKLRNLRERLGCFSLRSAFASI